MESLKKRLTLAMKEKKEYEERFLKSSLELDHKVFVLHGTINNNYYKTVPFMTLINILYLY